MVDEYEYLRGDVEGCVWGGGGSRGGSFFFVVFRIKEKVGGGGGVCVCINKLNVPQHVRKVATAICVAVIVVLILVPVLWKDGGCIKCL